VTNEQKLRRFEKALAIGGNTHTVADVLDRIGQQKAVCWPHGDSIIVTEVIAAPRVKMLNYWIVSGRLSECAEMQPAIDAWGVSEGCSIAIATGRMGWLRLNRLDPQWKPTGVKFVKDLSDA
jgi:hypothetical protein